MSTTAIQKPEITITKYINEGIKEGFPGYVANNLKVRVSAENVNEITNFINERNLDDMFFVGITNRNKKKTVVENITESIVNQSIKVPLESIDKKYLSQISTGTGKTMSSLQKLLNIMYECADKKHLLEPPVSSAIDNGQISDSVIYAKEGVTFLAKATRLSQLYNVYTEMLGLSKTKTLEEKDKTKAQQLLDKAKHLMAIKITDEIF
jgi:hypothetical protein